jgi:PPOX class probable F420-dependent enzyme
LPSMSIDPDLTALASGRNFAALTTLLPDGQPQTHMMWFAVDDEHVLINTEVHRQKYKNVQRDPRVTITAVNSENPYQFIEVRGTVVGEVRGDEARADIDALSNRYTGQDYGTTVKSERVILRIEPAKLHKNNY